MNCVVAGATGFTGERVVRRLRAAGARPTLMVRGSSSRAVADELGLACRTADLADVPAMEAAFAGHDTLLYVASMGFGHVPGVVAAAERAGIRRAVFVSTTAVLTRLPVRSKPVRAAAEQSVRDSGLTWTIIRPTMIYGSARDRNMCRLLRLLARLPAVPVPGSGSALQQPVHVDDVADAVIAAASAPAAAGREYVISGREPVTLAELVLQAGAAVGRRPALLRVPQGPVISALRLLERLRIRLPLRAEQVERLGEDKAFGHADAERDLGVRPRAFAEGILQEARDLGLAPKS